MTSACMDFVVPPTSAARGAEDERNGAQVQGGLAAWGPITRWLAAGCWLLAGVSHDKRRGSVLVGGKGEVAEP